MDEMFVDMWSSSIAFIYIFFLLYAIAYGYRCVRVRERVRDLYGAYGEMFVITNHYSQLYILFYMESMKCA